MREFFKTSSTFTKIEFWVLTTIAATVIFIHFIEYFQYDDRGYTNIHYKPFFDAAKVHFDGYRNYFIPQLLNRIVQFLFVMYVNFIIIPKLITRQALLRNIIVLILLFNFAGTFFGITNTYLEAFEYAGSPDRSKVTKELFREGFEDTWMMLLLLIIYTAIKYAGIYLLTISERIAARYKFIRKEAIVATIIWIVSIFFLGIGEADREFFIGWIIVIPSAIALYLFSFYKLIPRSLVRKKFPFFSYVLKCALILFITFLLLSILFTIITGGDREGIGFHDEGVGYSAFNSFFQFFITMPLTWMLYKRYLKGNEELLGLQKELGRSNANLDFLRSQINPHFLFNAMNTLYGTAIQENAERTSEGIQRLSDMMRFMLQENMQEKISLKREMDYLNNYIDIQKLRTDPNPNIRIETDIQQEVNGIQIAPMLLIPFVENAFKHGISFREPSQIKIILEVKDKTVYFDVYNTKHPKPVNDPEKDKSGIGLNNVKQRLQLLYKDKHELVIRETAKGFFIHLTLEA